MESERFDSIVAESAGLGEQAWETDLRVQELETAVHVAHVDSTLGADGTYFVHELGGQIVACGG